MHYICWDVWCWTWSVMGPGGRPSVGARYRSWLKDAVRSRLPLLVQASGLSANLVISEKNLLGFLDKE